MGTWFYIVQLSLIVIIIMYGYKNYEKKIWNNQISVTYVSLVVAAVIYLTFAVFRNVTINNMLDSYHYYVFFEKANIGLGKYIAESNFEWGYTCFTWLCRNIFSWYGVQLLLIHGFIYFAYVRLFGYIKEGQCKFLILCTLGLNLFSAYYITRMYISVAFSIFMFVCLSQKKYKSAFVFLGLSILFHNSAIILVVVYTFCYILNQDVKLSKKKLVVLTGSLLIITILGLSILNVFMERSEKYHIYLNTGSVAIGTCLCTSIVIIFSMYKQEELERMFPISRIMLIAVFVVIIVIPLQLEYSIMYRMLLFFTPLLCVMLSMLLKVYYKTKLYWFLLAYTIFYCLNCMFSFWTNEIQYVGIPYYFGLNL